MAPSSRATRIIEESGRSLSLWLFITVHSMLPANVVQAQYSCFHAGLHPCGVSFLCADWDAVFGFHLLVVDPSGILTGWKATCLGLNDTAAESVLKQVCEETMTMEAVRKTCMKILQRTMEEQSSTDDRLEFARVTLLDGVSTITFLQTTVIAEIIKSCAVEPERIAS